LRSISTSGSGRVAPAGLLGTSDPYRQQQDGYLPQVGEGPSKGYLPQVGEGPSEGYLPQVGEGPSNGSSQWPSSLNDISQSHSTCPARSMMIISLRVCRYPIMHQTSVLESLLQDTDCTKTGLLLKCVSVCINEGLFI
jgi:hypothetical protein